jgi:hypothetical protein
MSRQEIIDKTVGEIRSFLSEVLNGTSRYRSLHNLTEQVEHQYHGRFLIELIQNAHDALYDEKTATKQRIEIVIDQEEKPFGALYIANDGRSFSSSNFKALSNLGQSDKDPQKSIGNKGIGFRSVLEICKAPEIYSRIETGSKSFDGFCFCFQPEMIPVFEKSILRVVDGDNNVEFPMASEIPLLRWDDSMYDDFRNKSKSFETDWVLEELAFLSPYAMPIPLDVLMKPLKVCDFEERGFSTVIRLPFYSQNAQTLAIDKLEDMDDRTVIFLHRLNELKLICNNQERAYHRDQWKLKGDVENGNKIKVITKKNTDLETDSNPTSRYWLWEKSIGGNENVDETETIQAAVSGLPGKWPEVDQATIAIAIKIGSAPENGTLNIFLPTEVPSGCSVYFSAPFFGDMSRTYIDFKQAYNKLLLKSIAEKSVDVIFSSLAGKGEDEAAAIIDILAPSDNEKGVLWWEYITNVFKERGLDITKENIIFSDNGWNNLISTSLLPVLNGALIDSEMLRLEATYPIFRKSLLKRKQGIIKLFNEVDIGSEASLDDNAATVEAIARKLHNSPDKVDWNSFWHDVEELIGRDTECLRDRNVLLGTDNQLHSCGENSSVFFRPRSSGTDDEVLSEEDINDIPASLRKYLAFLNETIQVHTPRSTGGLENTAVHTYLSDKLVDTYGVERIFSGVLTQAVPQLPLKLNNFSSDLCRDILQWGLKLLKVSTGSMDKPIRLLQRLPAPCVGGWYSISETSFGPGWPDKSGDDLSNYLQAVNSKDCTSARNRMLLPPDHPMWGGVGLDSIEFLERAGVFNGLRLISVTGKDWHSKFNVNWQGLDLPEQQPPGFSSELWNNFKHFVENSESHMYEGNFTYEIDKFYKFPGFEKLGDFDDLTSDLLMKLLLISIPLWGAKWNNWSIIEFNKVSGKKHYYNPISPLIFALKSIPWMLVKISGETVTFRPSEKWYIPSAALMGGIHQFSHLKPLPEQVASKMKGNLSLINTMSKLGMPIYEPEKETNNLRLLEDLSLALDGSSEIEISNINVYLGQVRNAWGQFQPEEDSALPDNLIVQNGSGSFKVITPSEEDIVYLPDAKVAIHNGLKLHSKSIVAMDIKDAKRLKENFKNNYGDGIRLASELTLRALVNGEQWKQGAVGNVLKLSEKIPWLIPVILTVFAFSGGQSRGTGTKTFSKAVDSLRATKIAWVDSLEVGLWHGDLSVASSPVSVYLLSKYNMILANRLVLSEISLLSEAISESVDRADLDISIKLVLGSLDNEEEVTDELICTALNKLHITSEQYHEIQQRWYGDLSWTIRHILPLILLLQSDANQASLNEATSIEQLTDFLGSCNLAPLNVEDVLNIVKDASGFRDVGYKAWSILGERAQLNNWNAVLSKSGESIILNEQVNEQFYEYLNSSRKVFRSIIRSILRIHSDAISFAEMDSTLSNIRCPSEYMKKYWSLDFQSVMRKVVEQLREWKTDSNVLYVVENATSLDELFDSLYTLGMEPGLDPIEIHAENKKKFINVITDVQKIAIAWCLEHDIEADTWKDAISNLVLYQSEDFTKVAFVDIWDEAHCFKVLRKLNRSPAHERIWTTIDAVSSVKDLMEKLGVSNNELKEAYGQLEKHQQKQEIQDKKVNVCGVDFINIEKNLLNLWDHIIKTISDEKLSEVIQTNKEDLMDQLSSNKRKKRNPNPTVKKKKGRGRISQSMKDLIGLAGEIHAYRVLQSIYGIDSVGPSSWISEYSRKKFPENAADDGYGCDFKIHKNGKVDFIEVKATQGDDESFELGSSEVELAIDCANRRNKKFMILHVLEALSETPRFRLLPNPYDRKFKNKYKFEEAGLRVRYLIL